MRRQSGGRGTGGITGAFVITGVLIMTVLTVLRFGLLPAAVAFVAGNTADRFVAFDFTAWYATPGLVAFAAILAAAVWSFRTALGGRKVFKGELLDS